MVSMPRVTKIAPLALLLLVLLAFFARILFTDMIIRAPDILNESYWWMKSYATRDLADLFTFNLKAGWTNLLNSGHTDEGGMNSIQFLLHMPLILHFIPPPASVAWFIVLHLFFGAVGLYYCCRQIGTSCSAAFFAAMVFALSPEIASLINAGHVMKIATISFAPWAFFCLEKGFLSKRLFWFMATAIVLAFQFFNTHWQIAFYTCLCVGAYGLIRTAGIIYYDREQGFAPVSRLLGLNLVVLVFFLSTVSISLLPLANWSKATNRGVQSGANQGKGGLDREEAMSWSMPPEEIAGFVIPGFFGVSRQESGPNPTNIRSYYWGRMHFTQTASYMGLLPWLLVPLPLIFRRDKYTWLAVIGIVGGVLFSMGKYTPFYNALFDYFPGINRFRVPKMMMFIPVIGLGVLAARGIDLLMNTEIRVTKAFHRYLAGLVTVPVTLLIFFALLLVGKDTWIRLFVEYLANPTRYEQGLYLITQRWNNLMIETGIAIAVALLCAAGIIFGIRLKRLWLLPVMLCTLYLGDVWRVDDKFMFTIKTPEKMEAAISPVMQYIKRDTAHFRTLLMNGDDPMQFVNNGIPVMFTSNPVQIRRWQDILDIFSYNSSLPDMLNVRYLVFGKEQYNEEKGRLSPKFAPVYESPDSSVVVVENRAVFPKAWLVPSVVTLPNPDQRLQVLMSTAFNPRTLAIVESPPPFAMAGAGLTAQLPGTVAIDLYENERIVCKTYSVINSILVMGEKYYKGWKVFVDGRESIIYPVNHILRGVYLTPGNHKVEFVFDPLPYKIGKWLTLSSFVFFSMMMGYEVWQWRKSRRKNQTGLDEDGTAGLV